jgi:hypothetical protein
MTALDILSSSGEERQAMSSKTLVEALAAYADDLNRRMVDREIYLRQYPDQRDELEALLHLTERLKQALVPVQPSAAFVKSLARQLTAVDGGKVMQAIRGHRREIFIGAAAIGSALSVIGLVAYLVRNRGQVETPVASAG